MIATRAHPTRRSIIALAGDALISELPARALAESLQKMGIETVYMGREPDAERIVDAALAHRATSVELFMAGGGAVPLLRRLLRKMSLVGRSDLAVVVHRMESLGGPAAANPRPGIRRRGK